MPRNCRVCSAMEPHTIDRLLVPGYGPSFAASRWSVPRHHVKRHRDLRLVGERRAAIEADLRRIVKKDLV